MNDPWVVGRGCQAGSRPDNPRQAPLQRPPAILQVTLETTIGNKNPALWKYVRPEGCVLEWVRNVVANRLALDGASWTDIFKKFNSGT